MAQQAVLPEGASLRIKSRSGKVRILAESRDDVYVESGTLSVEGSEVVVSGAAFGSKEIVLRCPEGAPVTIGTASGRIELQGRFGRVHATSGSGSITVQAATSVDLRTASGDVSVETCAATCRVKTISGKVSAGRVGIADISTVSGRISLGTVGKSLRVSTASGRVEVGCEGPTNASVKTLSGGVTIRFPKGVRPLAMLRALSGKSCCECPAGSDCRVEVSSLSGRIEVLPQ